MVEALVLERGGRGTLNLGAPISTVSCCSYFSLFRLGRWCGLVVAHSSSDLRVQKTIATVCGVNAGLESVRTLGSYTTCASLRYALGAKIHESF